jgi:C1A family cysteine protease
MGKRLPYKYNLKPSIEKDTDLLFHLHVDKTQLIPQGADLRQGYSDIKDQGNKGSCTAFSAVSVLEYLLNKDIDLSELYFYVQELKEDGDFPNDEGSTIARSATVATTMGTCLETLWPYDNSLNDIPSKQADADAQNHKALTKYRVKTIDDILYSVGVLKRPILIGIQVYEGFENIGSNGYVPIPKREEELLGGHALNIVGYYYKQSGILEEVKEEISGLISKKKYNGLYFIVRNSWGESFGDKGYVYMPVEFLQKYSSDWWHIDLK